MAQPTQSQVHAVDPVMTNLLVGYMQSDTRFIAARLFPFVDVDEKSGTFYKFDKKYWFADDLKKRAPASKFARSGFGISTATYDTEQWGLEHLIPDEVRNASQVPMSLEEAGLRWLAQQSNIRKERAFVADFITTGVWDNTDNNALTDWDDYSSGDPVTDVFACRKTISDATGLDANTMALGLIVHNALINHPDVLDRIKYTQAATLGNAEAALTALFGLSRYIVGRASYNTANEGQTFSGAAIMDDDVLIGVVADEPGLLTPSMGYTFAWAGGGGRGEVGSYDDRTVRSTILQHVEQWDQKVVAADTGYVLLDIV